jgi:hypothetical protein
VIKYGLTQSDHIKWRPQCRIEKEQECKQNISKHLNILKFKDKRELDLFTSGS